MYRHGENLRLLDERSIFIDGSVIIGRDVTIYENNRIEGNTVIGDGAVILPGNYIKNTVIGDRTVFNASQSEDAEVGSDVQVGPYARLRPRAHICDGAKIGNFVEIKNANIGKGTKVSHLAYVGDADIGENCNIGCGGGIAFTREIQADQKTVTDSENQIAQSRDQQAGEDLEAECVADALMVLGAEILGGKDAGAGTGTEKAQVEHKQQSVDDGNTAHGNGTYLTNHDVVQQGHKIGDAVLDDNRNGDGKDIAVKCPVADVSIYHKKPQKLWSVELFHTPHQVL